MSDTILLKSAKQSIRKQLIKAGYIIEFSTEADWPEYCNNTIKPIQHSRFEGYVTGCCGYCLTIVIKDNCPDRVHKIGLQKSIDELIQLANKYQITYKGLLKQSKQVNKSDNNK